MAPFRRRFKRARTGGIDLRLPAEERAVLRSLAPQLRELLAEGADPALIRLSPPAYADDATQEAEYRSMVHDDLLAGRLAAIATFEATTDAEHLDDEAVHAWMTTVNAARLILGTRLDVGEDLPQDLDVDDPETPAYVLYDYLSGILSELLRELQR